MSVARDGQAGLRLAETHPPDLVILDLMLPGLSGYDVCRRLRRKRADLPILMLTAKGQGADIVLGLNTGADDYVTKPFSLEVVLARVQRLIQYFLRCPFSQARMIRLRPGRATARQVEVTEAGKVIRIEPTLGFAQILLALM